MPCTDNARSLAGADRISRTRPLGVLWSGTATHIHAARYALRPLQAATAIDDVKEVAIIGQGPVRVRSWFTPLPHGTGQKVINSATVWLALMAYWALADSLIVLYPPGGRPVRPDDWVTHAVFTVAGLVAIWCSHRTGFPAAWDARIPVSRRLLLPALIGVSFGIAAIAIEEITGATKIIEAAFGTPFTVAFPGSLLVYSAGAIVWESVFRLIPIPILLWLISTVAWQGRNRTPVFWGLAFLTAAIEPGLTQGPAVIAQTGGAISPGVFAAYAIHSYAFNVAAAASFDRYGLLAAVVVRLTYYMVWHVGYGNFLA